MPSEVTLSSQVTDPTAAETELKAVRVAADQRDVTAEACAVAAEQQPAAKDE